MRGVLCAETVPSAMRVYLEMRLHLSRGVMRVVEDVSSSTRAWVALMLQLTSDTVWPAVVEEETDERDKQVVACPSERVAWARIRLLPTLRVSGVVPMPLPHMKSLVETCMKTPGAPRRLVIAHGEAVATYDVQGDSVFEGALRVERDRSVWLVDARSMPHMELVRMLLFANVPGAVIIATTRTPVDTAGVADSCGFAPAFAVQFPDSVAIVFERTRPGRFVRGTGRSAARRRRKELAAQSPRGVRMGAVVFAEET